MDIPLIAHRLANSIGLGRSGITVLSSRKDLDAPAEPREIIHSTTVWGDFCPTLRDVLRMWPPPGPCESFECASPDPRNLDTDTHEQISFWLHGPNEGDVLSGKCSQAEAALIIADLKKQAMTETGINLQEIADLHPMNNCSFSGALLPERP